MRHRLSQQSSRRRAATFAMVVVSIAMLIGMASLTVDIGMLYRARAEAQASADAAAMAGAWRLMDNDRLAGNPNGAEENEYARQTAAQYAGLNAVVNESPTLNMSADVQVGRLSNPWDPDESLSFDNPDRYNTVRVLVRRDSTQNGPIDLFFAGIFGRTTADVSAEAFAAFRSDIAGFRPSSETGNAGVLPITLHVDVWENLMAGAYSVGDNWSYNADTGEVSPGSDGIRELNLYPGAGANQLPPGNFGTLDFGSGDNSTADISRQIIEGLSTEDLEALGGELMLGSDGTLDLTGDVGLSAAIAADLESIIGQPRTIPLFEQASGPGDNAVFTIVGFAGIRVMSVKLTGKMSLKSVIVQPAFIIDPSAVAASSGLGPGQGDFVYRPVELIR